MTNTATNPPRHFRNYCLLTLASLLPFHSSPADWKMEILPDEWSFAGFEHSLDISSVATADGAQCLVGSDESFYVQPGVIEMDQKRVASRRPIALPMSEAEGGKLEVDIEGIAFSSEQGAYFVTGSHGVGKKKGDFQAPRYVVCRLGVERETGLVDPGKIARASLLPWLEKTPLLAPHLRQPLQTNGLNIEGLASAGGKLFFGLRSPNLEGSGFVFELAADTLFGEAEPSALTVHALALGAGRGIREIAAVTGGFVMVTGGSAAEATKKIPETLAPRKEAPFALLLWDGTSPEPKLLGTLPDNDGKAESLLVLEDAPGHLDLLVVYDSLPGGLPTAVRLTRGE